MGLVFSVIRMSLKGMKKALHTAYCSRQKFLSAARRLIHGSFRRCSGPGGIPSADRGTVKDDVRMLSQHARMSSPSEGDLSSGFSLPECNCIIQETLCKAKRCIFCRGQESGCHREPFIQARFRFYADEKGTFWIIQQGCSFYVDFLTKQECNESQKERRKDPARRADRTGAVSSAILCFSRKGTAMDLQPHLR